MMRIRSARRVVAAAVAALAGLGSAAVPAGPAQAAGGLTCSYLLATWPGGFTAQLNIINAGPTINGWTVHWTFATPTQVTATWQARIFQPSEREVTATNLFFNPIIATSGATTFGWSATAAATEVPTDVTVNGTHC